MYYTRGTLFFEGTNKNRPRVWDLQVEAFGTYKVPKVAYDVDKFPQFIIAEHFPTLNSNRDKSRTQVSNFGTIVNFILLGLKKSYVSIVHMFFEMI